MRPRRFVLAFTVVCLLASGRPSAWAQTITLTTLHAFDGTDGTTPNGLLLASGGNFYGTTALGSAIGVGTAFRLTPDGALTTLFDFGQGNGRASVSTLIQGRDNNFYGTTLGGGAFGYGTVFQLTPAGVLTILYSFTALDSNYANADGARPNAGVTQGSDGNFYGTTEGGGTNGRGTVFQLTPAGKFKSLYSFFRRTAGDTPLGGVVQGRDGSFYGTTESGGDYDVGSVFRITSAGGTPTFLHQFSGDDGGVDDGESPHAGVIQGSDGNFYGTTFFDTAYRITPAGALTTLHVFSSDEGSLIYSGLIQGKDGNFYGTASSGGANGSGTVFQLTAGGTLTVLYDFSTRTVDRATGLYVNADGAVPYTGLVQDNEGNLFGTTSVAGAGEHGTIFRLSRSEVVQFTDPAYAAAEAGGSVSLPVFRTSGVKALAIHYDTADGTALAGRDYTATSGVLTWADGDISPRNVTVNLLNPGLVYGGSTRTFTVTLRSPNNGAGIGQFGTASVVIAGTTSPPVITSPPTASADVGTPFSYQITADNGPVSYSVQGLPMGLSVNTATGLISGTLNAVNSYSLTLDASSGGGTGTAPLALTVQAAGVPLITSPAEIVVESGAPYSYQITATNHPTSYSILGQPGGSTFNPTTGVLAGSQATPSTYRMTLHATNSVGKGAGPLALRIPTFGTPIISSAATASGTVGVPFSYQIVASHNPTAYGVSGLPAGLAVDAGTGLISGTPKKAGTSYATINVYNAYGKNYGPLTLTISAP